MVDFDNRQTVVRPQRGTQTINNRIFRHRDKNVEVFSANNDVSLEQGYFDKLNIEFITYTLHFANSHTYNTFRQFLARSNIIQRDRRGLNPKISVGWLFSGSIKFNRKFEDGTRNSSSENQLDIKYILNLNPTRFLHHLFQKVERNPEQFSLENFENIAPLDLLRTERISEEYLSLDGNDNYIPSEIFKHVRPFENFTKLYIEKVLSLLDQTILMSLEAALEQPASEIDISGEPNTYGWTTKASEVYWEYSVVDSLSFVNDLWHSFQSVLYRIERRQFNSPDNESNVSENPTGRQQNYNGIAIYANDFGVSGLKLIVYAKHLNRVRFELRYNRSIKRLFPRGCSALLTEDIEGLYSALNRYKEQSKDRLQKIINAMPDLALTERSQFSLLSDFLHELSNAHEGIQTVSIRNTLSTLLQTNRVAVTKNSDEHEVMKRLQTKYIVRNDSAYLRRDGQHIVFRLNDSYYSLMMNFRTVFEEN